MVLPWKHRVSASSTRKFVDARRWNLTHYISPIPCPHTSRYPYYLRRYFPYVVIFHGGIADSTCTHATSTLTRITATCIWKFFTNELPFLLVNLKRCFNPDSIIFYSFGHSYENFVTNRRNRVSLFSESTRKWKKEMFSWINLPFRISSWSIITSLVTESTFSSLKFYKFTLPSKRNYSC